MINEKLKRLEENLRVLNEFKSRYSLEDVKSDKTDEWSLRYGLLESIRIIIDIAYGLVSEKNLGMPKNYSECIALLVNNKYLDKNLGNRLSKMVGLRNLLVHEYGIIDVDKLYEFLDHLQDVRDFVNAVNR